MMLLLCQGDSSVKVALVRWCVAVHAAELPAQESLLLLLLLLRALLALCLRMIFSHHDVLRGGGGGWGVTGLS
jgi:hypothetical protein